MRNMFKKDMFTFMAMNGCKITSVAIEIQIHFIGSHFRVSAVEPVEINVRHVSKLDEREVDQ